MWLENLLHTERTSSKNIGNAILKKFKESKDKEKNESLNVREESEICHWELPVSEEGVCSRHKYQRN